MIQQRATGRVGGRGEGRLHSGHVLPQIAERSGNRRLRGFHDKSRAISLVPCMHRGLLEHAQTTPIQSPGPHSKWQGLRMRVLLVETSGLAHQALADLLRAGAHEVHQCGVADEAWTIYEQGQPALVILADVGQESLELCSRIRRTEQGDAVIIAAIVSSELREDLQAIIEAEIDECFFGAAPPVCLETWLALLERRVRFQAQYRQAEKALRESEAKTRAILETSVDGIVTIDERGIITAFNAAAESIFGYGAEEVIGHNVKVLMPSPYREEHDGYILSYLETGHRKIIGIGREVVGRRKDGSVFPLELAVSEVSLRHGRRLFTGMVRDITNRRRLEKEILHISEQERRRIGQDLHDGLGQTLTGISLIAQDLARTMKPQGLPGTDAVTEVTELIKEADEQARSLARGLIPVDLEAAGLNSALQRLATKTEQRFNIQCTFEKVGSVRIRDNTIATHLYRIAQEAVSNAVRHGRAKRVKISLATGGRRRLRIQDDGIGFSCTREEAENGMGVRIMRYRARIIGAALEIGARPGSGTTITCTSYSTDETI